MKAVNVVINELCVATVPVRNYGPDLNDVMTEWAGTDGVTLTPASGKVFGGSRCRVYGFLRKDNKWWTL